MWSDFHRDPRISYYLFLRQEYRCSAREAYLKLRQIDAMVVALNAPRPHRVWDRVVRSLLTKFCRLPGGGPAECDRTAHLALYGDAAGGDTQRLGELSFRLPAGQPQQHRDDRSAGHQHFDENIRPRAA